MSPIEFQKWLLSHMPPGVSEWQLTGAGDIYLKFEDEAHLHIQLSEVAW